MLPKKKVWMDLWDSILLVIMLESLIVPWARLDSLKPPSPADDVSLDQSQFITAKGFWPDFTDRESLVQHLSSNLYPPQGNPVYILDLPQAPVLTQEMGATNLNQPHENNDELSLETQDLIDVLWRQDIDMEKSAPFVDISTPYNQHENDVQVLEHKSTDLFLPWMQEHLPTHKDSLTDYSIDMTTDLVPWLQASSHQAKQGDMFELSKMEQEMDMLESLGNPSPPIGSAEDVWLTQALSHSHNSDDNTRMSTVTGFVLYSGFYETSMRTPEPSTPPSFSRMFSVDMLATPDLRLSPTDESQLFNNQQVVHDLVDIVEDTQLASRLSRPVSAGEIDLGLGGQLPVHQPSSPLKALTQTYGEDTPSTSSGITHTDYTRFQTTSTLISQPSSEYEEWERPGSSYRGEMASPSSEIGRVDVLVKLLEEEADQFKEEPDESAPMRGRTSHDEEILVDNGISIDINTIVESPLEHLNKIIASFKLTQKQVQVVKKIRRRGKNKVAARQCRARKVHTLEQLETETHMHKTERSSLVDQYRQLKFLKDQERREVESMKEELLRLRRL